MFKIVNEKTGTVVNQLEEYESAVNQMSILNCHHGWKHKARGWYLGIERELCVHATGRQEYGKYVITIHG